jgi:hypothetical protein
MDRFLFEKGHKTQREINENSSGWNYRGVMSGSEGFWGMHPEV